jgi:hypothetical protein
MVSCDWHAASVLSVAQFKTTSGAVLTVKVFVQEEVNGAQSLAYVHVTVVDPPVAEGATGEEGDVVMVPLQPPLAVVVRSHAANEALMADWVCPGASVLSDAQLNTTAAGAVTVKILVQVDNNGAQLFE